jgi:hypothetical protein
MSFHGALADEQHFGDLLVIVFFFDQRCVAESSSLIMFWSLLRFNSATTSSLHSMNFGELYLQFQAS